MIEALLIANSNLSNLQINDRAVYCHVITKLSGMMGLCTRALCARVELRYNMKQGASCMIMGYHSIVVWVESKVGGLNRGSDRAW